MTGMPYTYTVDITDAGGVWLNYFMGSGSQEDGESFEDIARTILARCPGTEGAQNTGWRVRVFGGTTIFAAVLGLGGAHAEATIPPDLEEIAAARAALAAHLAPVRAGRRCCGAGRAGTCRAARRRMQQSRPRETRAGRWCWSGRGRPTHGACRARRV